MVALAAATDHVSTMAGTLGIVPMLALLLVPVAAGARDVERVGPASAWWKGADMALARGDCARALAILNEQVVQHHYGAVARLGDIHETGACAHLGLPPARQLYEGLIADGIEVAKARLGRLYLDGHGVPGDVARAERLFKEAVLWMVAREFDEMRRDQIDVLMSFHGVPEALEAVLDWVERVESSPALEIYRAAIRLRSDNDLANRRRAALHWMQKAAIKKYPPAFYVLGRWKLETANTGEERRDGIKLVQRAGELGYPPALKQVGLWLLEAEIVERWDFAAMVWLLMALDAGQHVEEALAEAASRLDRDERVVAVRWAREKQMLPAVRPKSD
jgi:TPR repeat protein